MVSWDFMGFIGWECLGISLQLDCQDLPMSWLAGTKFAVFGLGDSTYSILAFVCP